MVVKIKSKTSDLGYQVIDGELQNLLFPEYPEGEKVSTIDKMLIEDELSRFGMELPVTEPEEFEVPFLPDLQGKSPKNFIEDIANKKYGKARKDLEKFLDLENSYHLKGKEFEVWDHLVLNPYWTRYPFKDFRDWQQVDHPLEDTLVYDVETLVKKGSFPIIGACLSEEALYIWLHPCLCHNTSFTPELVSIGTNKTVFNHSVMYDMARVKETYKWSKKDRNFAVCSQSMHIAVAGMGNQQRGLHKLWKKGQANYASNWAKFTSMNNLVDVYNLHVKPINPLSVEDKELREIFVKVKDFHPIKENVHILVDYAIKDVLYTYELGCYLLPKFFRANPYTTTFGGMIELNSSLVPVIKDWKKWITEVDNIYAEKELEISKKLSELAIKLVQDWKEGKVQPSHDPWYSCLEWKAAKSGRNKGLPEWYRKMFLSKVKEKGQYPITPKSSLAPILLKLRWQGNPIVNLGKKYKWCYECSKDTHNAFSHEGKTYARVPHPKGGNANCGSPLSKDYIKAMDRGIMTSEDKDTSEVMKGAKSLSYWSSYNKRAKRYFAVNTNRFSSKLICPQTISIGTVTRRVVEPFFQTLSDPKSGVIGSEAKSRIQLAPEDGYIFVGADVDGEELNIASGMANAAKKLVGSSAISLTQILGSKKLRTDSHSLLGIHTFGKWSAENRQIAKGLNFEMLFLAGLSGCATTIKKNRPDLSEPECRSRAQKALTLRRGKKDYDNPGTYLYKGGTDSEAYNFMLKNAVSINSKTPLWESVTTEPLKSKRVGKDFMTSRCNRCIQSSGVDFLHSFIVLIDYFFEKYEIDGRFILSIHDEKWTCVHKSQKYLAAWIFQMAHMITWAAFYGSLGLKTMAISQLFFSGVNIDRCIRKEAQGEDCSDTITPSNPVAVEQGLDLSAREMIKYVRVP